MWNETVWQDWLCVQVPRAQAVPRGGWRYGDEEPQPTPRLPAQEVQASHTRQQLVAVLQYALYKCRGFAMKSNSTVLALPGMLSCRNQKRR